MMRMVIATAALGLTGCWDGNGNATGARATPAAAAAGTGEVPSDCALAIRFGSYAMGIDGGTAARIEAMLSAEEGVTFTRHRWGREGEFTLCVRTPSAAVAETLFARIRPLLPADPRGPIEVMLRDGSRYGAPER